MIRAGADRLCFVISPGKSDILSYFGSSITGADVFYTVQPEATGLCSALFRALPLVEPDDVVLFGLPDTIWTPEDGYLRLPDDGLSFLLFDVDRPQHFDTVVTDSTGRVREIQVKPPRPRTSWIWGAVKLTGRIFHELHELWLAREPRDEFLGTLVNAYLARGGHARGVPAGQLYLDVGSIDGYRDAIRLLSSSAAPASEPQVTLSQSSRIRD
jgi:dTDP-glucose pyrophosphorylase